MTLYVVGVKAIKSLKKQNEVSACFPQSVELLVFDDLKAAEAYAQRQNEYVFNKAGGSDNKAPIFVVEIPQEIKLRKKLDESKYDEDDDSSLREAEGRVAEARKGNTYIIYHSNQIKIKSAMLGSERLTFSTEDKSESDKVKSSISTSSSTSEENKNENKKVKLSTNTSSLYSNKQETQDEKNSLSDALTSFVNEKVNDLLASNESTKRPLAVLDALMRAKVNCAEQVTAEDFLFKRYDKKPSISEALEDHTILDEFNKKQSDHVTPKPNLM